MIHLYIESEPLDKIEILFWCYERIGEPCHSGEFKKEKKYWGWEDEYGRTTRYTFVREEDVTAFKLRFAKMRSNHPHKVHVKSQNWASHLAKIQWCQGQGFSSSEYDIENIGSTKGEIWCFQNESDAIAFKLRYGNQ